MTDDELGQLLRQELHALASDVSPSPELMDRVTSPTRRRRPPIRRQAWLAVPVGALASVIVAVVILVLSGSQATPAYAVTVGSDGSVRITLRQLAGISGANATLKRLGFHIRVLPMTATCRSNVEMTYMGVRAQPSPTYTLTRTKNPSDVTVILAAALSGANRMTFALGRVTGAIPACVSSRGVGPGLPGWKPNSTSRVPTTTSAGGGT